MQLFKNSAHPSVQGGKKVCVNNGQATHCNATSCGARKAAWAKKLHFLICSVRIDYNTQK